MPEEILKAKPKSREYLEAALEQAKKLLPGWMYILIHRAAMPSSGGRASYNRRLARAEKGFNNGSPEGGMHAHGLDRRNAKTATDGAHAHLFVLPGSGEHVLSMEDGAHQHELKNKATVIDGAHTHHIMMPDGQVLETKLGGRHHHGLMVETTGFEGPHEHALVLPDGTEIQSLTVAEFVEQYGADELLPRSLPPASVITGALLELRELHAVLEATQAPTLPSIDEVLLDFAKSGELPAMPTTQWVVDGIEAGGAWCAVKDSDPVLLVSGESFAPGDVVEVSVDGAIIGLAKSPRLSTVDEVIKATLWAKDVRKATAAVDFVGPRDAKLLFVAASPSSLELARREAIIGPDGAVFQEKYLGPLGLTKQDVAVGFIVPVACDNPTEQDAGIWQEMLVKCLARYPRAQVVALGRFAGKSLGEIEHVGLPHPAAVRRHGDSGEVGRKLKALTKKLDNISPGSEDADSPSGEPIQGVPGTTLADSTSELRKEEALRVEVSKAVVEKQIVYGVVLDPYQVDLHNDWIPPAEIESTAHGFLAKSRVVGLKHSGRADAQVVESWVENYPPGQHELALQNLPHTVFKREFGSDVIHSGAWVIGVKLSDELWAEHKKGKLNAFSIGGASFKTQIARDAMPEVEFIELQPA